MIFQFQTSSVTFFEEDRAYFEKRISPLEKFLGFEAGDPDSVKVDLKITKNRHQSGEKFEASANITGPNGGHFHAEVAAENIKECADKLESKLKIQLKKFHQKKTS